MLFIYDTTNFVDHPIGGQLTSVRNFLHYLVEEEPNTARETLLVGVTTDPASVGKESVVEIGGVSLRFLPVAHAETDLAHVRSSLRLKYFKGLLKHLPSLGLTEKDINFIQTPEAYGPLKLLGKGRFIVMSHGSFINMRNNLRFYRNNLLADAFQRYLIWVIRTADKLLVLDECTKDDYRRMNSHVLLVSNSIDYREHVVRELDPNAIKLLYVGRLSAVKNIGPIIEAAEDMPEVATLSIVGDGEERDRLSSSSGHKTIFLGPLDSSAVRQQMRAADILVMNSAHEGVPMTVLEAMGMSLPLVSTDVGGIASVAPFGVVAEMTDGSSGDIKRAVRKLASEYKVRSEAAYFQSANFDYHVVCRDIYNHLEVGN